MHRTTCTRQSLGLAFLAALILIWPEIGARAQAPKAPLIIPINGTVKVQMSTKKPIKTFDNPKDSPVSIRTLQDDPSTVLVTGVLPDATRFELTDEDGQKESFDVIVQNDLQYLRTQLKRVLPTANLDLIPASNNSVIVAGTVTKAEDVDIIMRTAQSLGAGQAQQIQIINALRVGGVQQVQLDVVVAQVSRSAFRRMAFNFLADSRNTFVGSTVGQAVSTPTTVGVASTQLTVNGLLSGTPGAPGGAATNILGGVLHNSWGFLFFLQALRDESVVKLMAEPRLVTLSGRPASFISGGEQAIPVPAGLGQVGVQFEEFGTRLNFLPIVLGNGKIHLEVEPEFSDLNPANGTSINGTVVPGRNTSRVNTTVQLEAGQTFVIGGLIQHRVRASTSKVPVLGDIPFLNTAFSTKSYEEVEDELIIMVTPHLIDAQSCDQVVKVLPGQETRSPDDFELFLEGILEAPRGPRQVFQGQKYVPAYKNGPTYDLFPCGKGGCGANGCGGNGCGPQGCNTSGGGAMQPGNVAGPTYPRQSAPVAQQPRNYPAKGTNPMVAPLTRREAPAVEKSLPAQAPGPQESPENLFVPGN